MLAGREMAGSTLTMNRWALAILRDDLGTRRLATLGVEDVETALQSRADGAARAQRRSGRGRSPTCGPQSASCSPPPAPTRGPPWPVRSCRC